MVSRLPLHVHTGGDQPSGSSPSRCQIDTVHHFLDFLFVPQDIGLHSTDLVLLVFDLLLQLGQLRLQGLHGRVRDAGRNKGLISLAAQGTRTS